MGLIAKFKELFTEEDPLDKTRDYTKQLVIEKEVQEKEVKQEQTTEEKDLYKSPSTFQFPVVFGDEDLKQTKEMKKTYSFDREKFKPKEKDQEEYKFKPSPIISPVYGILDKDYNKEQITNKSDAPDYESKRKYKEVNIDVVRQKAFGTLEEDLELTILEDHGFIYGSTEEEVKEPVVEDSDQEEIYEQMGLTGKVEEDVTLETAYENYSDYGVAYDGSVKAEEPSQKTEILTEDLFELVNSMHKDQESRDEGEEDK